MNSQGNSANLVYEYNVIENGGMEPGAHLNLLQFGGWGTINTLVEYNTSYQQLQAAGAGEGYQFYGTTGDTLVSPTFAYNTMLSVPTNSMSYLLHGSSGSQYPTAVTGTPSVHDNYFDPRGTYSGTDAGVLYPGSFGGWVISGNYNMATGALLAGQSPSVTGVVASPSSGTEVPGNTITFTLTLSQAVTVTGTPTLTLNDGGTATYIGGSGTNALTFSYTVGASDSTVSALAITQVNLAKWRDDQRTRTATRPISPAR